MPVAEIPPNWEQTEAIYKDYLLHGGQVDTNEWYLDSKLYGDDGNLQATFTKIQVDNYSKRNCNAKLKLNYP